MEPLLFRLAFISRNVRCQNPIVDIADFVQDVQNGNGMFDRTIGSGIDPPTKYAARHLL
jgi:hypothetical protein